MTNNRPWFLRWLGPSWANQYHQHQVELIQTLELTDAQRKFLEYRWLDEVDWLEGSALRSVRLHEVLRTVAIVGGAAISGLVGYGVTGATSDVYRLVTFILTLSVTASVAIDEFFRFGDRWRHARLVVEMLRSEGALYVALAGPYAGHTHREAYPKFAMAVEQLARQDVREWVTQVVTDRDKGRGPGADEPDASRSGVKHEADGLRARPETFAPRDPAHVKDTSSSEPTADPG